jgi:hypothetical protein
MAAQTTTETAAGRAQRRTVSSPTYLRASSIDRPMGGHRQSIDGWAGIVN